MIENNRFASGLIQFVALVGKGLLVGAGYVFSTMVAGAITNALGLPLPRLGASANADQMLLMLFLSGLLTGLVLGPLAGKLPLRLVQRTALLFLLIFGVSGLINGIEGLAFTSISLAEQLSASLLAGIGYFGLALLLALLFRPGKAAGSLRLILRRTLARRTATSWTARIFLAGVLYVPIFFFFGILVLPFVQVYYQDPALILEIPDAEIIVLTETLRGLLFVLITFPLIAVLGAYLDRKRQLLWVIVTLALLTGWTPMIVAPLHPMMRFFHGMEITAGSIAHGVVMIWLLRTQQHDVKMQHSTGRPSGVPGQI